MGGKRPVTNGYRPVFAKRLALLHLVAGCGGSRCADWRTENEFAPASSVSHRVDCKSGAGPAGRARRVRSRARCRYDRRSSQGSNRNQGRDPCRWLASDWSGRSRATASGYSERNRYRGLWHIIARRIARSSCAADRNRARAGRRVSNDPDQWPAHRQLPRNGQFPARSDPAHGSAARGSGAALWLFGQQPRDQFHPQGQFCQPDSARRIQWFDPRRAGRERIAGNTATHRGGKAAQSQSLCRRYRLSHRIRAPGYPASGSIADRGGRSRPGAVSHPAAR